MPRNDDRQPRNILLTVARRYGRDYVTPEDVTEALRIHDRHKVRLALLHALSGRLGVEDHECAAFVAARGR
jgi:hypothetical protein